MVRRELDVAVGPDHEHPHLTQLAGEEAQESDGRRVGRLEIVNHDEKGRGGSRVAEEGCDGVEELESGNVGIGRGGLGQAWELLAKLGKHLRDIGGPTAHLAENEIAVRVANVRAENLDPRPIRWRAGVLPAASPQHRLIAAPGRPSRQLSGEATLPDARLSADQEEVPATTLRLVERGEQLIELCSSAQEWDTRRVVGHGSRGPPRTFAVWRSEAYDHTANNRHRLMRRGDAGGLADVSGVRP